MREQEKCENCNFWNYGGEGTIKGGYCQKSAPVSESGEAQNPIWPCTKSTDWCGDFGKPVNEQAEAENAELRRVIDLAVIDILAPKPSKEED